MSFLSKLGTLLDIAGIAAIPFTGGASAGLKGLSTGAKIARGVAAAAPIIGKVASNTANARAGARVQEATLNAGQDELALQRAKQAQDARASDESSAVRGGLLQGITDAEITRPDGVVDHVSGGLRPSAITGHEAMGKQFKDDALARIVADNSTPQLTPVSKPGNLDKLLNFASGVSGLVGVGDQIKGALGPGAIPDVSHPTVNPDPMSIVGTTPNVKGAFYPSMLPPQSTYRPKFTQRKFYSGQ